ncbi:hypothetical protein [Blautia sp.]
MELIIHSMFMDFTFLMTEDFYIHVEFQTTDSGEDDLISYIFDTEERG